MRKMGGEVEDLRTDQGIFNDLFKETPDAFVPGIEELSTLIYKNRGTEIVPPASGSPNRFEHGEGKRIRKKKVSYYLSEKVVVELSDAKAKIRFMVPRNLKKKVSLSRIVDYAVAGILEEFRSVGKDSGFIRNLIKAE